MQVMIQQPPQLTGRQKELMFLHGPLNLLHVIHGCLAMLQSQHGSLACIETMRAESRQLESQMREFGGDLAQAAAAYLDHLRTFIAQWPQKASNPDAGESRHHVSMLTIAVSRFEIAMNRLESYLNPHAHLAGWQWYSVTEIGDGVRNFLSDLANHSRGRYGMNFSGLGALPTDYRVTLAIDASATGQRIRMPEILWDTIFDLLANARKYTAPGGALSFVMRADDKLLKFAVSDSGRGIPPDEVARIVEFGYRATNAREEVTSIGGFGLTKASYLCHMYGGTMSIASEPGKGSEFLIAIPLQVSSAGA